MILAVACSEPAPPARVPVVSSRPHYVLEPGRYGPELAMRMTIRADRPIRLHHCNGAFSLGIQRWDGDTWTNAWIAEINGCFSAPIVVPPGGRHSAVMTIVSREHNPIRSGTYRAAWHNVYLANGEPLPIELRVSAPFELTVSD